jgi:hypothetical protein
MADLLERAANWLGKMRSANLSRPIVYSRDADSVQIAATVGQTTFEVQNDYGAMEKWESRDFLVTAADLVLSGVQITPQRGDRITDGANVYEVLAPGKEDVYRLSDPYGVTLRIHTKQVQ